MVSLALSESLPSREGLGLSDFLCKGGREYSIAECWLGRVESHLREPVRTVRVCVFDVWRWGPVIVFLNVGLVTSDFFLAGGSRKNEFEFIMYFLLKIQLPWFVMAQVYRLPLRKKAS